MKVRGESCVLRGKSEEFWDRCGDPLRWLLAEDAVCLAQGVTCCSLAESVTAARDAEGARAAWQRLGFVPSVLYLCVRVGCLVSPVAYEELGLRSRQVH